LPFEIAAGTLLAASGPSARANGGNPRRLAFAKRRAALLLRLVSDAADGFAARCSSFSLNRVVARGAVGFGPYHLPAMATQRTLILCKADAVARGLVGEILSRFERRGYQIIALKILQVDEPRAKQHYAEHDGKPFFAGLIEYITGSPIVALVVEGSDAIEGCRSTIGATNPIAAGPGTIRGDYAQTIGRNLVHGSDSPSSAEREIAIWFEPHELFSRRSENDSWLVSS